MRVDRITTWRELVNLEASWNELAANCPFHSWEWLALWWKHYGQQDTRKELCVLAVYEQQSGTSPHERLAGIAPWYLDESTLQGSVLRWLGDGEVCTDHLSLLCHPQDRPRVAEAIADALAACQEDWDELHLADTDEDNEEVRLLLLALEDRDCSVSKRPAGACWAVDLPDSWDDYLATLSKSHRKQLRQLERRVLETDRVKWHQLESAADLETAWTVLVDLHQRRRHSLGQPGCFASQPFHDFHREVVERFLTRDMLQISWLTLDGEPAAAEYQLTGGRKSYAYQGGVDPNRLADEPGRLSAILNLRRAIEAQHVKFDFLRGDEPYKAHWRAVPRPTCHYSAVPSRRLARLRKQFLNFAGTITDLARHSAQLVTAPHNQ